MIFAKGLIHKIYKRTHTHQQKKTQHTNKQLKMDRKSKQTFSKKGKRWSTGTWKMSNIAKPKPQRDITSHLRDLLLSKKKYQWLERVWRKGNPLSLQSFHPRDRGGAACLETWCRCKRQPTMTRAGLRWELAQRGLHTQDPWWPRPAQNPDLNLETPERVS